MLLPLVRRPRAAARAGWTPTPTRCSRARSSTACWSGCTASRRDPTRCRGPRPWRRGGVAPPSWWASSHPTPDWAPATPGAPPPGRGSRRSSAASSSARRGRSLRCGPTRSCSRRASGTAPRTHVPRSTSAASACTDRSTGSTSRPGRSAGLIRDYKASRTVTPAAKLADEGKLQLQLYALALARPMGHRAARGRLRAARRDRRSAPAGAAQGRRARRPAGRTAAVRERPARRRRVRGRARRRRRAGARRSSPRCARAGSSRDPIDDRCPSFCTFQAICRRERAAGLAPAPVIDEEDEEEQAG